MHDYEYEYEYEHDLDRTQREFASALQELQPEHFAIAGEEEIFGESEASFQHPSQEAEELELELAAELLEITSEEELDRFLGDVFKKVGGFVSGAVKSPVFKALGGVLKPIAKAALPIAGGALGTLVGGPAGGMIGSKLASAAGNLFGLELEGLSPEDREFEMAKGFVRLASGAAEQVKKMPYHPGQNPHHAAKTAVMRSSHRILRAEPSAKTMGIAQPRAHATAPGPYATAPGPHAMAPGPQVTAPGWSYPGATSERAGGARPAAPGVVAATTPDHAPISEPWSSDVDGAPPVSHGDWPPESLPAGARRRGTWLRRGRRIILIGV
jgi:hypothetical protein